MLEDYESRHFRRADGSYDKTDSPTIQTGVFTKLGLIPNNKRQVICDAVIYPSEYFCPLSFHTGILKITKNTYSIHHFDGSWLTSEQKKQNQKRWEIMNRYGTVLGTLICQCKKFKEDAKRIGFFPAIADLLYRVKRKIMRKFSK